MLLYDNLDRGFWHSVCPARARVILEVAPHPDFLWGLVLGTRTPDVGVRTPDSVTSAGHCSDFWPTRTKPAAAPGRTGVHDADSVRPRTGLEGLPLSIVGRRGRGPWRWRRP